MSLLSVVTAMMVITTGEALDCEYCIEQAIDATTQLNTLSFDALSYLTGNLCSDSFIPPGKVADYFGFQHLRDNTPDGEGHNTDFLTFYANNVFEILNDEQIQTLIEAAVEEVNDFNNYALARFPLMVAFRRELENDLPNNIYGGLAHLSSYEVMEYSAHVLYRELDAKVSINRAFTFAHIIKSLSDEQHDLLNDMVSGGYSSLTSRYNTSRFEKREFDNDEFTLIMTYASEMFAWFAGDVESDTYFCPERQANYFGSFFAKDAPAVGNDGYKISEQLTAENGEEFRENILNEPQREKLVQLVVTQEHDLLAIVDSRRAIATQLRLYLNDAYSNKDDIDIAAIYDESELYGRYDGNMSYHYTKVFTEINNSLNEFQWQQMYELRSLEEYECDVNTIYKYAWLMDEYPSIESTDFLFDVYTHTSDTTAAPATDTTTATLCQEILQFSGGSGSSLFLNDLQWIKIINDDIEIGYYYMAITIDHEHVYYLSFETDCKGESWWLIAVGDINNSDKPVCDAAIGRCKQSVLEQCDGKWAFAGDERGHDLHENVNILSTGSNCT